MRKFLILLALVSVSLSAQQRAYVVKLIDEKLKGYPLIARVTVTDTLSRSVASGYTDSSGIFRFSSLPQVVQIKVDSTRETCEGYPGHAQQKTDLRTVRDSIVIHVGHFWADRHPGGWLFEEGTLNFTSYDDSIYCSFDKVEPKRGGYQSLDVIVDLYKCGAFAKVELINRYTAKEEALYGDSLARVRAAHIVNYLRAHGLQKVEFVITTVPYRDRPMKNADGEFHEECPVIAFRILSW